MNKCYAEYSERINELLNRMTLKEKIGQLNQGCLDFNDTTNIKEGIRNGEYGSLIFYTTPTAGNDGQQERTALEILNDLQKTAIEETDSKIPLIYGRDVIHGHQTVLPIPLALAATFNPQLVHDGYRCVAKEAGNDGIHWTFSPMIDISRDPRWGRCIEGMGEDPYLTMQMANAIVTGFQGEDNTKQDSLAACAKHFIGYGAAEGGRDYGKAEISDYTLRNYYLRPFREAVESGVATVMNSFNEISGVATASSKYHLYDVLKDELGFDGYIISDWSSVLQLIGMGLAKDRKECAEKSINAGMDMDMVSRCFIENLEELVNEGKVSIDTIDEAVSRILYIKLRFGLFDNPYTVREKIDDEKHLKASECCSNETMILLKNKNHILPLSENTNVVAAGPMLYEKRALLGSWSLDGDENRVKTIADALREKSENVILPKSQYLWDESLVHLQKNAEVVVVVLGESNFVTGEANSLSCIELPPEQLEFVKRLHSLGKPVIGVLCFGRPIALEKAEPYFDAILYAWHSGTCTAQSIASILYGDINPSGKAPMTFPRCTGQIPIYYNCSNNERCNSYYGEKEYGPYSYDDCSSMPLYPFGYGLSYTTFEYSNLYAETDEITLEELKNGMKFNIYVTVRNTGEMGGYETSQCYIRDVCASMIRPIRELKGFSKNYIGAHEGKKISFQLGYKELAFYNAKSEFVVEPGDFDVFVGTDCYAENRITITIR